MGIYIAQTRREQYGERLSALSVCVSIYSIEPNYPHWDFDDPRFVLGKLALSDEKKEMIFSGNAKKLYGLS